MLTTLVAGFMAKQQGLASILDLNDKGNPLDDILQMVGRVAR